MTDLIRHWTFVVLSPDPFLRPYAALVLTLALGLALASTVRRRDPPVAVLLALGLVVGGIGAALIDRPVRVGSWYQFDTFSDLHPAWKAPIALVLAGEAWAWFAGGVAVGALLQPEGDRSLRLGPLAGTGVAAAVVAGVGGWCGLAWTTSPLVVVALLAGLGTERASRARATCAVLVATAGLAGAMACAPLALVGVPTPLLQPPIGDLAYLAVALVGVPWLPRTRSAGAGLTAVALVAAAVGLGCRWRVLRGERLVEAVGDALPAGASDTGTEIGWDTLPGANTGVLAIPPDLDPDRILVKAADEPLGPRLAGAEGMVYRKGGPWRFGIAPFDFERTRAVAVHRGPDGSAWVADRPLDPGRTLGPAQRHCGSAWQNVLYVTLDPADPWTAEEVMRLCMRPSSCSDPSGKGCEPVTVCVVPEHTRPCSLSAAALDDPAPPLPVPTRIRGAR